MRLLSAFIELNDKQSDSESESKALSSSVSQDISPILKYRGEDQFFNMPIKDLDMIKSKSKIDKIIPKASKFRKMYANKSKEVKSTESQPNVN